MATSRPGSRGPGRLAGGQPAGIGGTKLITDESVAVEGTCPTCGQDVRTADRWHEDRRSNQPEHDSCAVDRAIAPAIVEAIARGIDRRQARRDRRTA